MPPVVTTTAGLFPRYDAGTRVDPVAIQTDAGLDRLVDSTTAGWHQLVAPLADQPTVHRISDRGSNHGYVRTGPFETIGLLEPTTAIPPQNRQLTIPGPYSLAGHLDDRVAVDETESMRAIADWLTRELAAVPNHRTGLILEPRLAADSHDADLVASIPAALQPLVAALRDPIVLTWGGTIPERPYAFLLDVDLHAVGIDLLGAEEPLWPCREFGHPPGLALGCLDADRGVGVTAAVLEDRLTGAIADASLEPEALYALPNRPLSRLPLGTIKALLAELGRVSRTIDV